MGLYDLFGTDQDLEKNGFALEYGDATFIMARAGGTNEKFQRLMERKMRPYRSAVNSGTMQEETSKKILIQAYAETIILAWENVTDAEGNDLPFSVENVVKVFTDLPELFKEIMTESTRLANFVKVQAESDAKD